MALERRDDLHLAGAAESSQGWQRTVREAARERGVRLWQGEMKLYTMQWHDGSQQPQPCETCQRLQSRVRPCHEAGVPCNRA
jgi:hypothetical protein